MRYTQQLHAAAQHGINTKSSHTLAFHNNVIASEYERGLHANIQTGGRGANDSDKDGHDGDAKVRRRSDK